VGPNPTDRAKGGAKRSVLCDGRGAPLGLAIDGANRNDVTLFLDTLLGVPIDWPDATPDRPQHMCLDKGYDAEWVRQQILAWELVPHVRSRGEEKQDLADDSTKKARRWVVERLHSWLNRFRRILIRWEKKARNYEAMLHFAFSIILFRMAWSSRF
jgi:transposase